MSSNSEASPASTPSTSAKGTKGRPKGSQGESLIKRSKEVLGLDRVKDMQRRKKSTRDDQNQDSKASTRREQVLEAQRTHRMRTKIYIKELESEVLRLRKSEAAAVARAEMFEYKTQALLRVLHSHGIQPPSEHSAPSWETDSHTHGPYPASRGAQNIPVHSRSSCVETRPDFSAQDNPSLYQSPDPSLQLLPDNGDLSMMPSLFVEAERIPGQQEVGANVDPATPFQFDDSQAELDFVLTLERPCMHHLEEAHFGPQVHPFDAHTFLDRDAQPVVRPEDDPEALFSGHVLTTSMPLWQKLREEGGPVPISPSTVRKELEGLLHSSFQLGLRNEIAPVQILHLLKVRNTEAREKRVTVSDLQRLTTELGKYLKCYGFGAVFDEDIVRALVMQFC